MFTHIHISHTRTDGWVSCMAGWRGAHTHTPASPASSQELEKIGGGEAQELEMRRYFLTSNMDGCVLGLDPGFPSPLHEARPLLACYHGDHQEGETHRPSG